LERGRLALAGKKHDFGDTVSSSILSTESTTGNKSINTWRQSKQQRRQNERGWQCDLLGRSIGRIMPAPQWFNNPACGAVENGKQRHLECGLFSVNHCLAVKNDICIHIDLFRERAGQGAYPEGDFDDEGLQRNLETVGRGFECLQCADYQEAVRQISDDGKLAIFNGEHSLGCVVHMPCPRHWVAIVPPPEGQRSCTTAAILCDSLYTHVFALTVDDMVDLFLAMGARHMQIADAQQLDEYERQAYASEWCVYRVSQ
jgi:hypothetical protein